ncbi:MAG: L-histidine N(alpha)-methyltransferase [Acidobacteriota bacterium]
MATSISPSQSAQDLLPDVVLNSVLDEALRGLTSQPRFLPPWLFYDRHGSELFEQITELPEYYLTRTERSLLATHAADILREFLFPGALDAQLPPPGPFTIAELGAGASTKTGLLLQAAIQLQPWLLYQPIDVSPTAMAKAAEALTAAIPGLTVLPQVANYVSGNYTLHPPQRAAPPGSSLADSSSFSASPRPRTLVLWIGSSIGNFSPIEAEQILVRLRSRLQSQDALLLGADLAPSNRKPVSAILRAYNDAADVTAAFNRNILVRLNRELGANFLPGSFEHLARWNAAESRIEMHLESRIRQTVEIPAGRRLHRISFAAGETIHTENSYKFHSGALNELLSRAGFAPQRSFQDPDGAFCLILARAR